MKQRVKLTESTLRNIVKESVKRVLNEIDYSQIPLGDFTERNKWWKTQTDNDFPNHGIKNSRDWQSEYDNLRHQQNVAEKNKKAEERKKKKEEREHGFSQRELEDRGTYKYERAIAKKLLNKYNAGEFTPEDERQMDDVAAELMDSSYDTKLYQELCKILDKLSNDKNWRFGVDEYYLDLEFYGKDKAMKSWQRYISKNH